MLLKEAKEVTISGKDWQNPLPDTPEAGDAGAEHFQHHCQFCHGLDGQNTGVPFAETMSPPVANLAGVEIQKYTDDQLKWVIENGIRLTECPAGTGSEVTSESLKALACSVAASTLMTCIGFSGRWTDPHIHSRSRLQRLWQCGRF